jgi:myo-inositol 2-dehydrogenase / D-chiro-inositol 1-dehydrogenase
VKPIGVGFLGAGLVTQAIHLPALQRFAADFRIVSVMDVDAGVAQGVAELHEASWTTDEDVLITNEDVDVLVVASPDRFHARHLLKACAAGKAGVLAEKPLVLDPADLVEVRDAIADSPTELVVGTMHAYDEVFLEALARWRALETAVTAVDVRCYLPANDEMTALATTLVRSSTAVTASAAPAELALASTGITSVAIHDIPLVRQFVPSVPKLDCARFVHPWGYFVQGAADDVVIRYIGMMEGAWRPDWSMTVCGPAARLHIEFQPSFVLAGSCTVRIETPTSTWTGQGTRSGYEGEWDEMRRLLRGEGPPRIELRRAIDDAQYALDLVGQLPSIWKETISV